MTKIAVMGTGDELVQGEILNTNAQYVCQRLVEHQLSPGMSLTVEDELSAMTQALVFFVAAPCGSDHHWRPGANGG